MDQTPHLLEAVYSSSLSWVRDPNNWRYAVWVQAALATLGAWQVTKTSGKLSLATVKCSWRLLRHLSSFVISNPSTLYLAVCKELAGAENVWNACSNELATNRLTIKVNGARHTEHLLVNGSPGKDLLQDLTEKEKEWVRQDVKAAISRVEERDRLTRRMASELLLTDGIPVGSVNCPIVPYNGDPRNVPNCLGNRISSVG